MNGGFVERAINFGRRGLRGGLAALVSMLVLADPVRAETRIALVIGNSSYAVNRLPNPLHDADLIARTLRAVSFDVTLLIDADQTAMKRAMLEFSRQLRSSDSVGLFYYAGHGVQVDGENFLIPVGADIKSLEEVAINSVNLSEIMKTMERAEGRLNIAILDACRDNPFASRTRSGARGLAPVTAPSGTLIAYATAPGQVALDGDGSNSPYTAALAEAIPTPGIPLEDVFRRARRKVLEVTGGRQTPWEHSSLTGEFYFKPKGAEPEATARPGAPDDKAADKRLAEISDWERVKSSPDPEALRRHLERYPDGLFAELITLRLGKLLTSATPWTAIVTGSTRDSATDSPEALYERALQIEKGPAGASKLADAAALYRQAADGGLASAMYALGRAYDKGLGVSRDGAEAARWFGLAGAKDHPGAIAALGTMYEYGEGVRVDIGEAVGLYRQAAALGDANAMTSLGFLSAEGKGLTRDLVAARAWYTGAAEKGQSRAMYNLALMLMRGEGGRPDLVEAVRLLQMAVEKDHAGAMRELAYLYDEGRGVARNPKRASELVLAAVKAGDAKARSDVMARPDTWSYSTRREIQRRLASKGLYDGPAHGFFDTRTRRALDRLALGS